MLYHIGIDDNHWTIINSMHTNAKTSIKWKGYIIESFNIEQGVRQEDADFSVNPLSSVHWIGSDFFLIRNFSIESIILQTTGSSFSTVIFHVDISMLCELVSKNQKKLPL
jgi:hypothetical protein